MAVASVALEVSLWINWLSLALLSALLLSNSSHHKAAKVLQAAVRAMEWASGLCINWAKNPFEMKQDASKDGRMNLAICPYPNATLHLLSFPLLGRVENQYTELLLQPEEIATVPVTS